MKLDGVVVQTKNSRFTEGVVSLVGKAVNGPPVPAYRSAEEGCTDWVILAVQGPDEYLGYPYRKLVDVLREIPRVQNMLGLMAATVPHFSTVCDRKQLIPMKRWRAILDATVVLYDLGDAR